MAISTQGSGVGGSSKGSSHESMGSLSKTCLREIVVSKCRKNFQELVLVRDYGVQRNGQRQMDSNFGRNMDERSTSTAIR